MESQLAHFPYESALGFHVENVQGCQPPVYTYTQNSSQAASLMMVLQEKKYIYNLTQLCQ